MTNAPRDAAMADDRHAEPAMAAPAGIPAIDATAPTEFQTATFALG